MFEKIAENYKKEKALQEKVAKNRKIVEDGV